MPSPIEWPPEVIRAVWVMKLNAYSFRAMSEELNRTYKFDVSPATLWRKWPELRDEMIPPLVADEVLRDEMVELNEQRHLLAVSIEAARRAGDHGTVANLIGKRTAISRTIIEATGAAAPKRVDVNIHTVSSPLGQTVDRLVESAERALIEAAEAVTDEDAIAG